MEARTTRAALAEETSWVSRAISPRPTAQALNGILIEATETSGKIQLFATDNLLSFATSIEADITTPGAVVVPGKLLSAIAGSLPQKPVLITAEGNNLQLSCGKSQFKLPTIPLQDYPKPAEQPGTIGSLLGENFSDAVAQTVIAAAKDETTPALAGVQIKASDDELTMIATDRYRLAVKKVRWEGSSRDPFLLRARNLSDLAKPASHGKVHLSMDSTGSLFGFTAGSRRATVPLLSGGYPDVERLIPATGELIVTTDIAEFVGAVKRVRLVMDRPNQPLRLTFGNEEILLSADSGSNSTASESVEAQIDGQRAEVGFNPEYLLDALSAIAGSVAQIHIIEPSRPVLLKAPDDPSYNHVLMPVKI